MAVGREARGDRGWGMGDGERKTGRWGDKQLSDDCWRRLLQIPTRYRRVVLTIHPLPQVVLTGAEAARG
jgi:hypothetical protein